MHFSPKLHCFETRFLISCIVFYYCAVCSGTLANACMKALRLPSCAATGSSAFCFAAAGGAFCYAAGGAFHCAAGGSFCCASGGSFHYAGGGSFCCADAGGSGFSLCYGSLATLETPSFDVAARVLGFAANNAALVLGDSDGLSLIAAAVLCATTGAATGGIVLCTATCDAAGTCAATPLDGATTAISGTSCSPNSRHLRLHSRL